MRLLPIASAAALSILIAGCNSEPEETPSLEEAIPVDNPADAPSESNAEGAGQDAQAEAGSLSQGTQSDGETSSTMPSSTMPGSSMQSGSNEDGGRTPDPSRTKLLPAD